MQESAGKNVLLSPYRISGVSDPLQIGSDETQLAV